MASGAYRTPTTRQAVREYVLGGSGGQNRSDETLLLNVNHSNLKQARFLELRMNAHTTVGDVKDRLYLHVGTRPGSMTLLLRRSEKGEIVAELSDENMTLGEYEVQSGDWLHVIDEDPHSASAGGWLEDTSLVPKYELSEEAYAKKENTYRKFKEKMVKENKGWSFASAVAKANAEKLGRVADFAEEAPDVSVGNRAQVWPGGRRGTVRFVGKELKDLPQGWWVGIEYDEPVGKNDGSVKGVRYFKCEMGYGALVRPSNCEIGEFEPLLDGSEDGSEDEI